MKRYSYEGIFDYVRDFDSGNNVIVGRIVNGHRYSLYSINLDRTYDGHEWCRNHGMNLIDRVPNIENTVWYEIWASDDYKLMTAFII